MTAKIVDIVYHLPDTILTNETLAAEFEGVTPDEIFKLSGVRQRHIADISDIPSDLALQVANQFFQKKVELRNKIDVLLYVTEGLDYKAPTTACSLHRRIGLPTHCLSLDIPGGCTGFVNALQVSKGLIASTPSINNILILTAETVSKVLHPRDVGLRMTFGDGACAILVTKNEKDNIGHFISGTDGSGEKSLWIEASCGRDPVNKRWLEEHASTPTGMKWGKMHMDGAKLLHFSLSKVPQLIQDTLKANKITDDDIKLYVFHQASKIILRSLQRKCKIAPTKFFTFYENIGNTVSSTIPIALHQALKQEKLVQGDRVMLVGFGIGFSWNATVVTI